MSADLPPVLSRAGADIGGTGAVTGSLPTADWSRQGPSRRVVHWTILRTLFKWPLSWLALGPIALFFGLMMSGYGVLGVEQPYLRFLNFFISVYILFASIRKEEFKERLSVKARSVAQLISEIESSDSELLARIEKNNPTSLPNEKIIVYNEDNQAIYSSGLNSDDTFSESLISEIRSEESKYIKNRNKELYGFYYRGKIDHVVVICSAHDVFGYKKLFYLRIILIGILLVSLVLLFFIGRTFATRALQPVADFIKQVNNIKDLKERISVGTDNDEIALLANTFNNMLYKLEISFKTQKNFIINASHELKTPLTSLTGNLEVTLLKERTNEEYKKVLVTTLEDVKSLNSLTNRLLILLRTVTIASETSFREIRVDDVLWKARSEYLKNNRKHQVEISFDDSIQGEKNFKISGIHELLKIAFLNLIDNGCKYSSGHKVDIHLAMKNKNLNVIFQDEGIGIPENEIKKIFQPFYRASNVDKRKGYGIGMSIVDRIISMHNGTIHISSLLNKGTTITLSLPLTKMF